MAWNDNLYRQHFRPEGELHLRILVAGWGMIDSWWRGSVPGHPFWVIYANDGDGAELNLPDGRVLALRAGELWLMPAWIRYTATCTQRVGQLWIHADPIGLPPREMGVLCQEPLCFPLNRSLASGCADLRSSVLAFAQGGNEQELRCTAQSLAHAVFARWWASLTPEVRIRLTQAWTAGPLAPAFKRINDDLATPLYNQSLARICGLSPSHFARLFRHTTGKSPAQYVMERRLARAAEHLLLGNQAIETIATNLGFPDRYYFTRVFTRHMGCSPAAYRRGGQLPMPTHT